MTPDEELDAKASAAYDLLVAAIRRDASVMPGLFERIGTTKRDVYAACCGWAEAFRTLTNAPRDLPEGAFFAVLSDVDQAEPADRLAVQFISAYLNGQEDTDMALFNAAATHREDVATDFALAVLRIAADAGRAQLAGQN